MTTIALDKRAFTGAPKGFAPDTSHRYIPTSTKGLKHWSFLPEDKRRKGVKKNKIVCRDNLGHFVKFPIN